MNDMNVPDAVDFYKPDAAYQTTTWHLNLASELDFTNEDCEFDTKDEAETAWRDNLELIQLKIKELQKMYDDVSTQEIGKTVD